MFDAAAGAAGDDADALRSEVLAAGPDEAGLLSAYQQTRKSLIDRLGNWEDQRSWDEFYQTYWRLIYSVGLKNGLRPDEAMDTVQEVVIAIAKQSQKNQYDSSQGSFKSWLMNLTRWRINDQFRLCFVWTEAGPEEVEIVDVH